MEGKENLYFALGELAYAVAKSDGQVQREERQKIHDIVVEQTASHNTAFDISEIIFHLLQKDHLSPETAYERAMKDFRLYSNYLNEDMKVDFVAVLEKVARAFQPITDNEKDLIEKFKKELDSI